MRQQLTSLGLCALLVYATMGLKCDKATTLSWSKEVVSALRECEPLLVQAGLPAAQIDTAISWGDKLVTALENPSTGTGDPKQIAASLISAFEQVVLQTNLITDANRKTLILAILGIANIALHHIADNITPAQGMAAGPVVGRFKASKVWRCRDAKSGRYEKMAYCKANPTITVVETR